MVEKITFNNRLTPFMDSLNEKVNHYFRRNNLSKTGNWKLYTKTLILVPLFILFLVLMISLHFHPVFNWLSAALLGFTSALVGFNVMHDGSHGAYSGNKFVNLLMAHTMNLLGSSAYFWTTKHNVLHHTYTNIARLDEDIEKYPWFRFCRRQKREPFHRFQHFYWVFLYAVSTMFWVFFTDFKKYFSGKIIENYSYPKMNFSQHLIFWITKIAYTFIFIILPVYMIGVLPAIVCFVTMHIVLSLTLTIVFQLSHVVEGPSFSSLEEGKINKEWAIHQLNTTANFSNNSKVVSWLVGGLNFHIEHHLFPKISHIHHPVISKYVRETCSQFNITYMENPTFFSALRSHVLYLKSMGTK